MNPTLLRTLSNLLEQERDTVQAELAGLAAPDHGDHAPGDYNPRFPNYGEEVVNDGYETPGEVAEFALNVNMTGQLQQRLSQITAALERLSNDTYGTCSQCGQLIAVERLEANPAAETCISCANA